MRSKGMSYFYELKEGYAPAMALVQTTVELAFMGRVIAVFTMVSSTMMPLGMVIFGPLSDKISINIILIFTGIGVALLSILLIISKNAPYGLAFPCQNR